VGYVLKVEPIRNLFASLFLASIGMLINIQFLWAHMDILVASLVLVIVSKTIVVTVVVRAFGYSMNNLLIDASCTVVTLSWSPSVISKKWIYT
jgi:Kef-type K+ transport system membrane component KefB